ncbi:centractin [Pelomyxa schiedti]|nr:centractin [Pelomyxa schiedti]
MAATTSIGDIGGGSSTVSSSSVADSGGIGTSPLLFFNQPLVLDNGTGTIKADLAGVEHKPKLIFSNCVGRPKHVRAMAGALEGDHFVGERVTTDLRGLLALSHPMTHGMVTNWTDMEKVWNYTFNRLKIQSDEHPVLLTEPPLTPRNMRQKSTEIFFETFNSPAFFTAVQSILSMYSSGHTTGLVCDCGDGVTHVVPVVEGFAIPHGIMRTDLAGRDVTEHLHLLLRKSGCVFTTSAEMEIVREIKESACYVSVKTPSADDKHKEEIKYTLPDQRVITLTDERYRAPELLFSPEQIGDESLGMGDLVYSSVTRADTDLRGQLWANVLLCGGTTLLAGFAQRLLAEMKKKAPPNTYIKIFASAERQFSAWSGGSLLVSLASFKKMWVTRKEYDEGGHAVVNRKLLF